MDGSLLKGRARGMLAMLGAGHFVWEEAADAFAQLLGEWIDEHS